MTETAIFTVGGTVQAGGGLYLPRPADDELLAHCLVGDFCYVLTARQMGKSSLMVRTAETLRTRQVHTVILDLTRLGTTLQPEQWYLGLVDELVEQLNLNVDYQAWWRKHTHLGVTQRLSRFLREMVLESVAEPLVIFIDEIDTTLSLSFSDDFFAAIRACYNARSTDPIYKRLSFVLLGVATPGDLIRDPLRTPFNIGTRIDLIDFTLEGALPLADGLNLPDEQAMQVLAWALDWTGGHPYLTQRLCRALLERDQSEWTAESVAQAVDETFFGERSKQDGNLQFVRDMLTLRASERYKLSVLQFLRDVQRGRKVKDEELSIPKMHLKLSGMLRREGENLVLRNKIYAHVFDKEWLAQNWPISWKRRVLYMSALLLMLLIGFGILNLYDAQITKPYASAQTQVAVLAKKTPVSPEDAKSSITELKRIAQNAQDQNFLMQFVWGDTLKKLAGYKDPQNPVFTDYSQRRFNWLKDDFKRSSPIQLRIVTVSEMAHNSLEETRKFLKSLKPEELRSVWDLNDITARKQQVKDIFNSIHPTEQDDKYDSRAPRVLAFLAEGVLRINQPDLAERALESLREMHRVDATIMVEILSGEFKMGFTTKQFEQAFAECQKATSDGCVKEFFMVATPARIVHLPAFKMDIYEVTNAAYKQCVDDGVCVEPANSTSSSRKNYYGNPDFNNYPVINVNWYDAATYCAWRGARLPSEAEWEKAARGIDGRSYPWGEGIDTMHANYDNNDTTAVDSYENGKSPYGIYNMVGNVWEWTTSWYDVYPGGDLSVSKDFGQTYRVLRGGAWGNIKNLVGPAFRVRGIPSVTVDSIGFRCASSLPN